jgi:hypothetical protein
MTDLIDKEYTDDQIKRAKELEEVLHVEKGYVNGAWKFETTWGLKTYEGLINTILNIMYGGGR